MYATFSLFWVFETGQSIILRFRESLKSLLRRLSWNGLVTPFPYG